MEPTHDCLQAPVLYVSKGEKFFASRKSQTNKYYVHVRVKSPAKYCNDVEP